MSFALNLYCGGSRPRPQSLVFIIVVGIVVAIIRICTSIIIIIILLILIISLIIAIIDQGSLQSLPALRPTGNPFAKAPAPLSTACGC